MTMIHFVTNSVKYNATVCGIQKRKTLKVSTVQEELTCSKCKRISKEFKSAIEAFKDKEEEQCQE